MSSDANGKTLLHPGWIVASLMAVLVALTVFCAPAHAVENGSAADDVVSVVPAGPVSDAQATSPVTAAVPGDAVQVASPAAPAADGGTSDAGTAGSPDGTAADAAAADASAEPEEAAPSVPVAVAAGDLPDERKDTGDFSVIGDGAAYDFADGVLTVKGDVEVSTEGGTAHRIAIVSDATVRLGGVTIKADAAAPAIKVLAGVKAVLHLVEGTVNTVTGGAGHAGVEVEWVSGDNYADLTIEGEGALNATGGNSGAGIGGSKGKQGVYGNITINGGTINATGSGRSAGIGSSDNPLDGTSHGSYKFIEGQWGDIVINGGTITAKGVGNGAGIGGGNHTSSGRIIINGGTVYAEGDSGIGSGLGSSSGADKGPGYYYADVTINGGNVTAYATNNMGAGIGGGMYADAYVTINDGIVNASVNQAGNAYQGGAGIGGGYQGVAQVVITGGTVTAQGGNGSAGIGNGALAASTTSKKYENGVWSGTKNVRTGKYTIEGSESGVFISGGTVTATGGKFGAGIGTGNSSEWCNVAISGGTVTAVGYASSEGEMEGGAGIGSGVAYSSDKLAYRKATDDGIRITGGSILAIGGWGAAGIGSGANNKQAIAVAIDAAKASIEAYSDGTKFAIDTRVLNADGTTSSAAEGANPETHIDVTGNILQGTFVHAGVIGDKQQSPEGLKSIEVTNDHTGESKTLTRMPAGYRGFATTVSDAGTFTVFTDDASIGDGQGRYFAKCATDVWDEEYIVEHDAHYVVESGKLADNYYLFPVKSVVVTKVVEALPGLDVSSINETFYFALWVKPGDGDGYYLRRADGSIWVESVRVVNGVPITTAKFIGVDDMTFGVWEVADESGRDLPNVSRDPLNFGAYVLVNIATADSSGTDDNDAVIDRDTWLDRVTVTNSFAPVPAASDPESDPTPIPSADPEPEPAPEPDPESSITPGPGQGADPEPEPVAPDAGITSIADDPVPLTQGAPIAPVAVAAPAVVAVAPAVAAIADDATPLAAAPEAIEDDVTPLAAFDDPWCWVHWWIILGILITSVYSLAVLFRRQRNSNELKRQDDEVSGAGKVSPDPSFAPAVQPAL